ncbi:MAG TPA: hypothetical protein VK101_01380 [Limnochordia bacterium]|jgi:hypothetical protein|nr:hypothetical protein [Limnochordia bacterium]
MLRRRAMWILVTIRTGEGPRIWIPVPLGFLDECLRGIQILAWCFPPLTRLNRWIAARVAVDVIQRVSLKELASSAVDIARALRDAGPVTLVDVRNGESVVTVRLV